MSKKKATMTLKDFHGGSIPSDLPLPSAPGVTVRPSDRVGFDRQTPWGNPIGRPDHRLRPGSAGTARNLEDKTPFLTATSRIGRNFDEDERKPLDGVSAPRRTVSDDSIRALPIRVEPKSDYVSPERVSGRPGSTPNAIHVNESSRASVLNVNDNVPAVGGPHHNAWGLKKEVVGVIELGQPSSWSAPDAAIKLAHASALEKVTSGRWHSKQQSVHKHVDVEVIRHTEPESGPYSKGHNYKNTLDDIDLCHQREFNNPTVARQVVAPKVYEKATSPVYQETKERTSNIYADMVHLPRNAGKFVGSELQTSVVLESVERPKLKLLPRSKPTENVESFIDNKPRYQEPSDTRVVNNNLETNENSYTVKTGLGGSDNGNRAVERPKLSLKPRSQHQEQLEGNTKRERNSLFGGARPRELVLKERGIDDVALSDQNVEESPNKVKPDVLWTETVPPHSASTHHHIENIDNTPLDHRIVKNIDRRDHKGNTEKSDAQRRNWRNENRRSKREPEKHHHHQQQQQSQPPPERPHSPETWRKPVEQQPPTRDPHPPGPRYRKAASAVELAQAFSRSMSDRKTGQRGLPSRVEVPFSRLTGPQPRPQINGY